MIESAEALLPALWIHWDTLLPTIPMWNDVRAAKEKSNNCLWVCAEPWTERVASMEVQNA